MDAVGPNEIAFQADDLLTAITKEFSTVYYVYQFALFSVWLWFSSLFFLLSLFVESHILGAEY
jgi:hypothetical protein